MKDIFAAVLLLTCVPSSAAEPVNVLSLPLGGKLIMPTKQCSFKEDVSDYRALCWVGPPTILKDGTRMGHIGVPGSDQRPKWSAHGAFKAQVASDGTLEKFTIETSRNDAFVEILNSITGRFGQSQKESKPGARDEWARWDRKDIQIRLRCDAGRGCTTEFTSFAEYENNQRAVAAEKAKDAARLASP